MSHKRLEYSPRCQSELQKHFCDKCGAELIQLPDRQEDGETLRTSNHYTVTVQEYFESGPVECSHVELCRKCIQGFTVDPNT